jgi:hypothetical protein
MVTTLVYARPLRRANSARAPKLVGQMFLSQAEIN